MLLNAELIEESESDTAHPVVCVYKKDGNVRLCVDYRTLNAITKPDDFSMEIAVDLMFNIGKDNIITTLYLLKDIGHFRWKNRANIKLHLKLTEPNTGLMFYL
ncbi:hypothetical protein AVEN_223914-1 [Araneus ventricosus]|uniref:Transposon Ty3-I Gag-Pol polyprotein n=1 Tax=Araneus ventricosus TaxID=182803 RepID=A0A4Y2QZ21_ARAVE|nr:hypothetical protein AVEN_223914-1 [Araneus ventricosus]